MRTPEYFRAQEMVAGSRRPRRFARALLTSIFAFLAVNAYAQSDSETSSGIPDGPLLRPAADFSQWMITYSYAEDRAPKSTNPAGAPTLPTPAYVLARPRTIVTTKTKNIIHELITDLQQHQRENWYVEAIQYRKDVGEMIWFENQPDLHPDIHYTPLPANGFRELDWISAGTFTGKAKQGGHDCLVFKTTGKVNSLDSALTPGKDLAMVAYIDAKSRLPVEVDIEKEIRTYQFTPPPQDVQALPEDLVKQIKAGEAGRAIMAQPAGRPF